MAFLGLFYAYPMASIIGLSLGRAEGPPWLPLAQTLTSATARSAVAFTLQEAVLSTLLTLAVGLPGAYVLARYSFPGKAALRALTAVPFVLPTLVVAAAFDALLGPSGLANTGLAALLDVQGPVFVFTQTYAAILVAHVFYNTAIVLRLVGDFWSHLDPRLTDAARVLGAGRLGAGRHVTAPLLAPAVMAAAILVFLFCFTSFGVILVLGGPRFATLEVEIYYQTVALFNLPVAAVLALLQMAFTLAATVVYTRLARRTTRPTRLAAARTTARPPRTAPERALVAGVGGGLVAFLVLPLSALALRSVTVAGPAGGWTLAYYGALLRDPGQSAFAVAPVASLGMSLVYATATAFLALAVGLPAAWSLSRRDRSRLDRWLDPVLMLPLGTSAVTLGLGFIVALGRPPLDLRASLLLVPLAHTLVAFPFVVRSLVPALGSIGPGLREAAAVLGASPAAVARHVDLPLVGRAALVAATFAFMISIGEFGATALVSRPGYPTAPIAIYRFLSRPGALHFGQAMALSTLLMLVTAAGIMAVERFRIAEVGEF